MSRNTGSVPTILINNVENDVADVGESHDDLMYYNMKNEKRGFALIFGHTEFDNIDPLLGYEKDISALETVLSDIGFTVKLFKNLNFDEFCYELLYYSSLDYTNDDCILICVLTHGSNGSLETRDCSYAPHILWQSFNSSACPSLKNKPKIFLIQACHGTDHDSGVTVYIDGPQPQSINELPIPKDTLICYAAFPGYYSFVRDNTGSWFIQTFVKELENNTKQDILSILTYVVKRVAYEYMSISNHEEINNKKQIPYIQSTLHRLVLFNNKHMHE